MVQFYVDGSKLDPEQDAILQVKDAGGEVVVGPFMAGTNEAGPWYRPGDAGVYFDEWLGRGVIKIRE